MEKIIYKSEREGQIAFFENYGIPYQDNNVLIDNTDGVYNGNLFEFKLTISNPSAVLFQAIKYLSKMRIKGESVPANILLIDLNNTTIYLYKSQDYFNDIHKVYIGAASKNNKGFIPSSITEEPAIFNYSKDLHASAIKKILKGQKPEQEMYMPIDIDENCIIGWAKRYYTEKPNASKGDFLGDNNGTQIQITGEIREPKHFKNYIRPYTQKTNEKFKYLMDCLNDRLSKKDLGAFYTPMPYAKKAAELVLRAVNNIPNGNDGTPNDYIILDRCAGTGNLEEALIGLKDKNGDDLISHCIVSTYEYYEYKVLSERIGDLVRDIIPPTEQHVEYGNGIVLNADALSKEFLENKIIKQYIDDPNCTVILFENPPFRDMTVDNSKNVKRKGNCYIAQEFKKAENRTNNINGTAGNDLANLFIWSGWQYYLRKKYDSYVLFSPVKYFKWCNLSNKKFIDGFLCNRQHFHATPSAVSCILWQNEDDNYTEIQLNCFDIIDNKIDDLKVNCIIKKCYSLFSQSLYDKRSFDTDSEDGICCDFSGEERRDTTGIRVKKIYNENIIGYIRASSFNCTPLSRHLLRCAEYDGNGFFLRSDNFLEKLPLWVAKYIPLDNWYEKDVYATTADGGNAYTKDSDFLKCCFIYTCLSNQNKCLSFEGSNNRFYRNELCFDTNTLASNTLKQMQLTSDDEELIALWTTILKEAKDTKEYNPKCTYGVYQITKELNTKYIQTDVTTNNKNSKYSYNYPELNGSLQTLRCKLKDYYKKHITEKMFQYELLK